MTDDKKLEILQEYNKDLTYCQGRFSDEYEKQYKDSCFESGEQYTSTELKLLEEKGKTAFTTNVIRTTINRICNAFILNPAKMGIDKNAEIDDKTRSALRKELDKVMTRGGGHEASQVGHRNQTTAGRGFMHIYSNYLDQTSMVQQVFMDGLDETANAYVDGVKVDGSDSTMGIYMKEIPLPVAKEQYGENVASENGMSVSTVSKSVRSGMCPVVLYYKKGAKKVTRSFRGDGTFIDGKVSDEEQPYIVSARKVTTEFVMAYEIVGNSVQSGTQLNIPWIPIIPILGNKDITEADGTTYTGVVQQLHDSQRLTNAYVSAEADAILSHTGNKYMATPEQVSGFEDIWTDPSDQSKKLMLYNRTTMDGAVQNPPAPLLATVNTSSLIQSKESAKSDMQKESGIFDSQLGTLSGGVEGADALAQRTYNGEIATAHHIDNLYKSLQHASKVLMAYFRIAYVEPRKYKDGEGDEFMFNFAQWADDINGINIEVSGGNSVEQKARATRQSLAELAAIYPVAAPLLAVEMLDTMTDLKNKDELVTKMKKALPVEYQDEDTSAPDAPDPEAIAALEAGNATIEEQKNVINLLTAELVRLDTQAIDSEKDRMKDLTKVNIESMTKMSQKEMDYMKEIDLALIKAGQPPIYGAKIVGGKADENQAAADNYNSVYEATAETIDTELTPEAQDAVSGENDVADAELVMNRQIDEDAVLPDLG